MTAVWDQDAEAFTTVSDMPGFVIEAETLEEFVDLVRSLAPEVIAVNVPAAMAPYTVEIVTLRELALA